MEASATTAEICTKTSAAWRACKKALQNKTAPALAGAKSLVGQAFIFAHALKNSPQGCFFAALPPGFQILPGLFMKTAPALAGAKSLVGQAFIFTHALKNSPQGCFLRLCRRAFKSCLAYLCKMPPHWRGQNFWWARQDLNPRPSGYEPPALTS